MTDQPRDPTTQQFVSRQGVVEGVPLATPTATEKGTAGELPHKRLPKASPTAAQQERNDDPVRGDGSPGSPVADLIRSGPHQASVIRISSDKE